MSVIRVLAVLAMAATFALAAGCGDDDAETTTTTSAEENAEQTVDAAVKSCSDEAQQLGGAAGTALGSACTSVGNTAKQAVSKGGKEADKALKNAETSCKSAVGQLPSGQAQDALTQLCNAIASSE